MSNRLASFFHSYDLRGIYPDEIGEEEAEKVGKAYGTFIQYEEVLVGCDGRKHRDKISNGFIKGILSTGTDVAFAGMVPTPLVYFGQVNKNFKSAAVVTASHNPPEYTGFKFNLEEGKAMSREGGMKEIEDIYESEDFESGEGKKTNVDLIEDYIESVAGKLGQINLDVAINCGNGVTGVLARKMFEKLGCNVKMINESVDGSFPNHLADPTNEEAQEATINELNEQDLGIIFDGDGDRAGFVLPGYGYISEDFVIALLSEESLKFGNGSVIYDLRASKLVSEKIKEAGGDPEEMRVGHTFISERIHDENNVIFAGEVSGHYYFPIYDFPWDDGLFAAALMAKICSKTDLENKIESFPDYPVSPELRIDCPQDAKQKITDDIAEAYSEYETSTKDGVKVQFDSGWALIRPSSTEPKMSVRCEADSEEDLERILGDVKGKVNELIENYS